jgi:hypothetical protein
VLAASVIKAMTHSSLIALMLEATRTSETLVNFYQTTRRYNPENSNLRTHRRENLKSFSQLCNKHHAVFNIVACVYFLVLFSNAVVCEAVEQAYQAHFLDAAVPNKSTIFRLENQRRHCSQTLY